MPQTVPSHRPVHASVIDDLIGRLRERAKRDQLKKTDMARMADLHPNTLAGFDDNNWAPAISTLRRLEAALLPST